MDCQRNVLVGDGVVGWKPIIAEGQSERMGLSRIERRVEWQLKFHTWCSGFYWSRELLIANPYGSLSLSFYSDEYSATADERLDFKFQLCSKICHFSVLYFRDRSKIFKAGIQKSREWVHTCRDAVSVKPLRQTVRSLLQSCGSSEVNSEHLLTTLVPCWDGRKKSQVLIVK